jgi:hypothetical protein
MTARPGMAAGRLSTRTFIRCAGAGVSASALLQLMDEYAVEQMGTMPRILLSGSCEDRLREISSRENEP